MGGGGYDCYMVLTIQNGTNLNLILKNVKPEWGKIFGGEGDRIRKYLYDLPVISLTLGFRRV